MWPPRHLLRTIEAVSIPHRQSGAGSRAREAHGVLPNSHHDPSSRGARDIAESAFQLIFREGSRSRFGSRVWRGSRRAVAHTAAYEMEQACALRLALRSVRAWGRARA